MRIPRSNSDPRSPDANPVPLGASDGRLRLRYASHLYQTPSDTPFISPCAPGPQREPQPTSAFSLVEITLALAIVTSSLLVILGLLPVGLKSMHESAAQYGITTIAQQISGELQEMPFTPPPNNPNYAISLLKNRIDYYTREGAKTTQTDPWCYFTAKFTTTNPSVPGVANPPDADSNLNLRNVIVTITYPATSGSSVLTFLTAKQGSQ